MSDRPISDYALLSDCRSAALIARDGSLDWLCLPRFDSPAQFARLLGPHAGHWRIGPAERATVTRRYLPSSLVLETRFTTESGSAVLCDALATGADEHGHDLGRNSPHALLRTLECTAGEIVIDVEYAPRPEYGLIRPLLRRIDGGLLGRGGASVLCLSTTIPLHVDGATATARIELREGERAAFALHYGRPSTDAPRIWQPEEIHARLQSTLAAWESWSRLHQSYEGPWAEQVLHSGRVLQGLTYQPTGAIVAAATTSLPEAIGGERNWDYRFTWIRDASLTLDALWIAACPDEAQHFFEYLAETALVQMREGDALQVVFGIEGEHDLTERVLPHLPGWRGSRPVRVGNGAWHQRQLDVYGELLAAAYKLRDQLADPGPEVRGFLVHAVEAAARRWREKDHGIWEVRRTPRDYLYSKLMCWVALDRGIDIAGMLGAESRVERWRAIREEIRRAILARGWSQHAGSYTQAFDSRNLDAANLMLPIVGFLPADDPRMHATIDAIEAHLTDERGLLYRYRSDDGLAGGENSFLLCSFWLAQARAMAGEIDRAKVLFERAAGYANDLGLLAEEVDSKTGQLLGNFPQAFSHIGLVNAAYAIHEAEQRAKHRARPPEHPPD